MAHSRFRSGGDTRTSAGALSTVSAMVRHAHNHLDGLLE